MPNTLALLLLCLWFLSGAYTSIKLLVSDGGCITLNHIPGILVLSFLGFITAIVVGFALWGDTVIYDPRRRKQ